MSEFSIKQYQSEVEKIIHFGGTKKETAIRNAFYNLLNEYAKAKGLMIVTEVDIKSTNSNKTVRPDGTLKDSLRQDWGYWESKDESDKIDEEIKKKFDKGYPKENILFEDSQTAVLIQNSLETMRVSMNDTHSLHLLITAFTNFERPEVKHFRKAIELFKQDIPKVTETLRNLITSAEKDNPQYVIASDIFLKLCHDSINPNVTRDDVREMIIQHILTEDVFNTIFDETQFHRENNIARELESVIHTFFTGSIRKTALANVHHYYQAINAAAAGIADHHEKQKFLKVIYETFYKSYNPKAADRLGVVYTPNEIVQFMIKSADYLLHKHFNKFLEDKGVEILDPATGTGTFICDIIDYIRKDKLDYKYKNEMHANEVAILPYYISNLNIEFTYTQKMGAYSEFENLCFVDTLDNMGFAFVGKQIDLFAPFTEENSKRIRKQNTRKIAVIIGNPPYNANQLNENENNKNRAYPEIDKRIKETFIKFSNAQKSKVYDMYARFYRWAFDRLDNNGIVAFITNRSFIDSKTFDGFRKSIQIEFDTAYVIDLGGDIRANMGKGESIGNVFGIITGVAIMFLVKRPKKDKKTQCNIQYASVSDFYDKEAKLQWLSENPIQNIEFQHIQPDKRNKWLDISESDFFKLLATIDKANKLSTTIKNQKVLFRYYSNGCVTNRDEWVYDFSKENLVNKIHYFINEYNVTLNKWIEKIISENWENEKASKLLERSVEFVFANNPTIKWSGRLFRDKLTKERIAVFDDMYIRHCMYRPYVKKLLYYDYIPIDIQGQLQTFFPDKNTKNLVININGNSGDFYCLCTNTIVDLHLTGDSQCIPLYYFSSDGRKLDNITDWGLEKFAKQYKKINITKESIFYYTYAVLHDPSYRVKYELNLKSDFPHIPFYKDFDQWVDWGKSLIELHTDYEIALPYSISEITTGAKEFPKTKLKSNKLNGSIIIDENTTLIGIPNNAWEYKLGNRSALEWVLDQYKESAPSDSTIAEKFNSYKFSDYKPHVIDLLKRVCTISVETMRIIEQMAKPS